MSYHLRGELDPQAKLTEEEAWAIRKSRGWSAARIGEKYGVSKATVHDIRNGRTWRHQLEDAPTENAIAESVAANTE